MTAFVTLAEIERALMEDEVAPLFIVPGVLPAGPVMLYGASGAGKTGAAVRTAVAVAAGLRWADRDPVRGCVLYVAAEDLRGAKRRLVAAARALGQDPATLPVAVMEAPPDGLAANRTAVAGAARVLSKQTSLPVALIVVDTLAAAFGAKGQDDATAAGDYMNNADKTAHDLGCCFLSIHHTGKLESAGMRGSQVFFDRADAVLKVKAGQGGTSFLQVEKLRNGPGGARFAFDIAGNDIDTAAGRVSVQVIRDLRPLVDDDGAAEAKERKKQTIADQMLAALVRVGGVAGVSVEAWKTACYDLWTEKNPDSKRKLFSKTRKQMQEDGIVSVDGETVTVTVTSDAMVTPLVTQEPETVTVTVTNPVSIDTGDSDRTTGPSPKQKGKNLSEEGGEGDEVSIGKATAFPPGCGTGSPATDPVRGDGDGDGRLTDAA